MADINPDRHWFIQHPQANYKVRPAAAGEVERLMRAMLADGQTVVGDFIAPETSSFAVMAIKLPRKAIARLLVLKKDNSEGPPADALALYALVSGYRVPIDTES